MRSLSERIRFFKRRFTGRRSRRVWCRFLIPHRNRRRERGGILKSFNDKRLRVGSELQVGQARCVNVVIAKNDEERVYAAHRSPYHLNQPHTESG